MLVAWLTAVTVRPGTAPPDSSDTMPVTVARPVWAAAVVLRRSPASAMKLNRGTKFADARIGDSLVGIPGDGHGGSVPENQRGVQTPTSQRSFTGFVPSELQFQRATLFKGGLPTARGTSRTGRSLGRDEAASAGQAGRM